MSETERSYEGKTALVTDDNRAVRLILRRMLEKLGFEVDEASDGQSALTATSRKAFDLVFTDLSMPGMDGMTFMREARARGVSAPVIVLTATGSVTTAVEAIKCGAFEFIEKPIKVKRLGEIVHAAMSARSDTGSLSLDIEVEEARPAVGRVTSKVGPGDGPGARGAAVTGPEATESISIDVDALDSQPRKPPPASRTIGLERIGRYEVEGRVGRGGMGVVYRCRDPLIGRQVAVKVLQGLSDEPAQVEEMSARFRREAAAAGSLKHPCIVDVHDMGRDEATGDWFLVMELLVGKGLGTIMDMHDRMAIPDSVSLGFHISDALAYAHAKGVVHRDIKPSNVLMLDGGGVKLLDFGLAALEGWNVTMSGRVFGSPSYMAPERIRGNPGGPAADQFSLGVLIYEALAGDNPFEADSAEGRLRKVLENEPEPLSSVLPGVPGDLSDLVDRMMAKDEKARFPSMDEVADAFMALGQGMDLHLRRYQAR